MPINFGWNLGQIWDKFGLKFGTSLGWNLGQIWVERGPTDRPTDRVPSRSVSLRRRLKIHSIYDNPSQFQSLQYFLGSKICWHFSSQNPRLESFTFQNLGSIPILKIWKCQFLSRYGYLVFTLCRRLLVCSPAMCTCAYSVHIVHTLCIHCA